MSPSDDEHKRKHKHRHRHRHRHCSAHHGGTHSDEERHRAPRVGSSSQAGSSNADASSGKARRTQTFHQPSWNPSSSGYGRLSGAGPSRYPGSSSAAGHQHYRSSAGATGASASTAVPSPHSSLYSGRSGSTAGTSLRYERETHKTKDRAQSEVPDVLPQEKWEQDILKYVNWERRRAGLHELKLHPKLTETARKHAEDNASRDEVVHRGSNGSRLKDRLWASGYDVLVGHENAAAGQWNPAQVHRSLMKSPEHARGIFREDVDEMGSYVAWSKERLHWIQLFGKRQPGQKKDKEDKSEGKRRRR